MQRLRLICSGQTNRQTDRQADRSLIIIALSPFVAAGSVSIVDHHHAANRTAVPWASRFYVATVSRVLCDRAVGDIAGAQRFLVVMKSCNCRVYRLAVLVFDSAAPRRMHEPFREALICKKALSVKKYRALIFKSP